MLSIRSLSIRRGSHVIIENFSHDFQEASLCALLGPNGSGKTSLLRCLAGTDTYGSDRVFWENTPLKSMSILQRSRLISWLPAEQELPFDFTVRDLLLTGRYPWHQGFPGKKDTLEVEQVLEQLGLRDHGNRPYNTLSSGEQRKVMAGRVLCQNTRIMILDEPCAHLDISISFDIMQLFQDKSRGGHCVIMSLHRPELALRYAGEGVLISGKNAFYCGPVGQVCSGENLSRAFGVTAYITEIAGCPGIHLAPRK